MHYARCLPKHQRVLSGREGFVLNEVTLTLVRRDRVRAVSPRCWEMEVDRSVTRVQSYVEKGVKFTLPNEPRKQHRQLLSVVPQINPPIS